MDTARLIEILASDRRPWPRDPQPELRKAAAFATALAAAIVFATLSIRPDLSDAAATPAFAWKLASTASLGAGSFSLVLKLSRPGDDWLAAAANLTPALALVGTGAILDYLSRPAGLATGSLDPSGLTCLSSIVLAGVAPLCAILAALRRAAPTHPAIAGAAAGLSAGGITATFFAAHCASASLIFTATWYSLACVALAALGAAVGHWLIRW